MTGDSHTEVAVETYARPALLLEPVDAKIETLQALQEEEVVSDLAMHTWPSEVAVGDRGLYDEVEDTFRAFERWADANGVSVRPPFSIRTRDSAFTDETRTVLVTPVMSLAIYLDDRLAAVFPHSDGEVHHPVSEAIAALKVGEPPIRRPVATPDPATDVADGCRACGGTLVNVQGLLACHDCQETEPDRLEPNADPAGPSVRAE